MKTSHSRPNSEQAKASDEPHCPAPVSVVELARCRPARSRRPAGRRCWACASRRARRPRTCSRSAPAYRARPPGAARGTAASGARACRPRGRPRGSRPRARRDLLQDQRHREDRRQVVGPGGRASCRGCSGGSGSPGRSGSRLTQCVGIASSVSRNFVCVSAMAGQPYPPPMATRGPTTARRWNRRFRSTPPATSRWTTSPRRRTRCPSTRPSAGRCSSSTRPRARRCAGACGAACARGRTRTGAWSRPALRGGPRGLRTPARARRRRVDHRAPAAASTAACTRRARPLLRDRGRRRAGRRPGRRPARPRGDARVDVPPRPRRRQRPAGADPRRARRARLRPVRHPAPTEHTTRMGARLVEREDYEARLRAAADRFS